MDAWKIAVTSCAVLKVDWPVVAQMSTALIAIATLIVGPRLAFNASRRLAIAQSRQAWLDALRRDVAELIAVHQDVVTIRTKHTVKGLGEPDTSASMTKLGMLSAQIRLRLNLSDPAQYELHRAVKTFVTTYDQQSEGYDPNPIVRAMDPIGRKVWRDIKSARF